VVPGVRIEDMGHKMGCNGVDNGKLWFDSECPQQGDSTTAYFADVVRPHSRLRSHLCTPLPESCKSHATSLTQLGSAFAWLSPSQVPEVASTGKVPRAAGYPTTGNGCRHSSEGMGAAER
jgi:hypothetical protein